MSKTDRTEIDEQIAVSIRKFSEKAKDEVLRQRYVIEMPDFIRNKAASISAHFLLPAGAKIVDMACGRGEIAYVLAQLNPRAEIIGIDRDEGAIEFARRTFCLPNLSFRVDDITIGGFADNSVDGVVNSNVFHEIYSAKGYNPEEVSIVLEKQIRKLKIGGTMLVRDYLMPPEEEYVLLEFPDAPSQGMSVQTMSVAELLIQFSQTARPMGSGCEGFFLEELAPTREKTRLFRLPHKWALEFIHRKEYREHWNEELKQEYTFFTWADYRREFARFGMRMVYSAPYWNPWVVKKSYDGKFQLYNEQGGALNPPATNYFIVAQKTADKQSLILEERRPSKEAPAELDVVLVRDDNSGKIQELVRRPGERCDLIPYRLTRDGRVVMYVRSGYPRPIINAVYRGNANLDGKRWSGHLVEPIVMNMDGMTDRADENQKLITDFIGKYAGLKVTKTESMHVGATWYPAPDRIDEAIEPVFMEVYDPQKTTWPVEGITKFGFVEAGTIIELDAGDIVRASQVGMLSEPRLELHAYWLLQKHGLKPPGWIGEEMPIPNCSKLEKETDPEKMLADLKPAKFTDEKGKPKHLKAVRSVFVEEGKQGGAVRGLASKDVEFIVTGDGIENIAVIIPVTKGWDNSLMVELEAQMLPVPQRIAGDGGTLVAPSFVLPKEVKTLMDAKVFIGKKFGVPPDRVGQLGESYFTHVGITPQRVYPFMIATQGEFRATHRKYTKMKRLWWLWCFSRFSGDLLKLFARVHMRFGEDMGMAPARTMDTLRKKGGVLSTQKTELHGASVQALGHRKLHIAQPAAPAAVQGGATEKPVDVKQKKGALKSALGALSIKITETKAVKRIDKEIFKIGAQLKKKKEDRKLFFKPKHPPDGAR